MRANQLRLWFASMAGACPPKAGVLLCALRRIGLEHTRFADAACGTLRLKLLKTGARVTVSARRIKLAMTSATRGGENGPSPTSDYPAPA